MRLIVAMLALLIPAAAIAQEAQKPPYWASIRAGQARMRTGPARTYPASWLYRRAELPVRVVQQHKEWRKVEDPDGTQGWMQANLLSATRTALVRGTAPLAMLERPVAGARVLWRAAPGVVGRVSACGNGWCRLDVKGRAGFVELEGLWGVEATETLP
ncbi:MAG TPA: SH3 domain-containing protein [Sphingomonas sp.]|jgi:SH3-like domain-containing protein